VQGESIATDRPAITNSSVVVPDGSFQAESGFFETSSQGQSVIERPGEPSTSWCLQED
jgi:hypothetical protein